MSVTLSDPAVRAANKLIESRTEELDGERVLAFALGEVQDEELEAMRTLRGELHRASRRRSRRSPSVNGHKTHGRSIAIGRHAYDYLKSQSSLEDKVRKCIRQANARRTLVGLAVPDAETAKQISEALREGAKRAEESLEKNRLETAAARVDRLAR